MKKIRIKLNTVEDVKQFVSAMAIYEQDAYIKSDNYVVNAKSILGIFSLDFSKDMTLEIEIDEIIPKIKKFVIDEI